MEEHHHHHHHDFSIPISSVNAAYLTGIILNFLFVILEVVTGFNIHSLSLLSDAGHNFTDVGALALSLLAIRLLRVRSKDQYTYGYRKTSILVALVNAMFLLVSIGAIVFEAVHRLFYPEPIQGKTVAIVAGIGIIINFVSARMFLKNKDGDLNIKSAYLHLLNDAIVSIGLVLGGILMYYSHWFWIDSVLSMIIAFVILISTWNLFKDSLRLSLDGVPANIRIEEIKEMAKEITGVKDIHHIHIWAISTTENALTAHLSLQPNITVEQEQKIKHDLKHRLLHHHIHHITLETERDDEPCDTPLC